MKKKYLNKVRLENTSYKKISFPKTGVLKKHQYSVVEGYTITGDAPKEFIRAYEYGIERKDKPKKWSLYIAKLGHKWYPVESITEYLLNELGRAFGLNMAESKVVRAGDQIRFLSKYFLRKDEELIHGADLFAGYLGDKTFVEEVESQKLARDFFTLQFTQKALKFAYPYYFESILKNFIKMLLFDALVGNNDRHFYNWGVVRHIERQYSPVFSPIYDTARGLFWNTKEQRIINVFQTKKELSSYIKKYCENSKPKIGCNSGKNLNHFELLERIYKSEFGITKNEIKDLFLRANFEKLISVVQNDFVNLLSKERLGMIIECLNYRYNRIFKILEG